MNAPTPMKSKAVSQIDRNEFLREQFELLKRKRIDENIEWQDVADFRSTFMGSLEHRDTCRKGSKIFYEYLDAGWIKDPTAYTSTDVVDFGSPNEAIAAQKERIKAQTERLETNRWIRELSRDEMITQHMVNAIQKLQPFDIPDYIEPKHMNRSYLLAFADSHYGIEYQIKDLFGNIINEYSPEIFETRMWDLLNQTVELILKNDINELHIWELGDGLQGILRLNSQLMKLRYGIIDSSILYANFLAEWLNELSKYVRIKFQMVVDSNHNQLRLCNAPKNAFPEENMSKSMLVLIKERLKNNPNVVIIENPTGMNFAQLSTFQVLGCHGEVKNRANLVKDFSVSLGTPLDYVIGAHIHHSKSEEVGINSESINIRSIIGVDPYGMSLNKVSNAGASLFVFELGKGKTIEYSLKLN